MFWNSKVPPLFGVSFCISWEHPYIRRVNKGFFFVLGLCILHKNFALALNEYFISLSYYHTD